jgi:putative ubiquitin-RnfH superfamily antitoxin RatB of RatAB toxin-antitoxin module
MEEAQSLSEKIQIEVVYGLAHKQKLLSLPITHGMTVEEAIVESGIIKLFPEIDLAQYKVGRWKKAVKLSTVLEDLDRIEIYRPLIADPKEVRKRRAEKAKLEGRADKTTGGRVNPLAKKDDT